ncbi:MAG: RDD family protein [Anaerolineae bacterium]|nr:RDD family protein [Anaerolineae bacterium]
MSNLNSNLLIDTPENLVLEAEIAGFGSRFVAALIDYLIIYVTLFMFGCLFYRSITLETDGEWAWAILFLLQYVIYFFYHLIFEYTMNGQTPGKRQIGIRVVQANGMPLSVTGLIIRNFVRLVDFLPVFYGVGLLMFFITKKTQRLGDLAGRTIVIREQKQISLRSLRDDYTTHYLHIKYREMPPDYINLDVVTDEDRYLISNYLQRRGELKSRETIVVPLALRVARKMGIEQAIPIYSPRAAETLLEHIARAFELAEQDNWPPRPSTQSEQTGPDTNIDTAPDLDPALDDIFPNDLPPDEPDTSWQRFRLD